MTRRGDDNTPTTDVVESGPGITSRRTGRVDVIVVGFGCAGASAAIAAADAGASVLLIEKSPHLGGLSLLSSGYMRVANDAAGAADYLNRTNGGRVDRASVEVMAEGFVALPLMVARLAARAGAVHSCRFGADLAPHETADLYDWPGRESLGWAGIDAIPGFDAYSWAKPARGHLLMRTLEINIEQRRVEVWFDAEVTSLIWGHQGVTGVVASPRQDGQREEIPIEAAGGVVLATGGFEFEPQMLADYLQLPAIHPVGHPHNTGDGIRLAQSVGASLWHMWHFHGSYGFTVPGRDIAVQNHLGGARRVDRPLAWILIDQHGRRFCNEIPPAPQDTPWRDLQHFDAEAGRFDRIPCWMVLDEYTRQMGPIAKVNWSSEADRLDWSADNGVEIERGWILQASTVEDLGSQMGLSPGVLQATLYDWNESVKRRRDPLGRPPDTMVALDHPPFYAIQAWPVCVNTHGGPRHDARQRILNTGYEPIPGLYAAGELGSFFGNIYLLGGNISEGLIGGKIAGIEAAARARSNGRLVAEPVPSSRKPSRTGRL